MCCSVVFFFKQKTAYEMRISDWSSDVCSSDLVEMLEILLERSFTIPGINRAVGLDAIVGLVPVVGDLITAAMGAYLIWEARNLGMPRWKIWRDRKSVV